MIKIYLLLFAMTRYPDSNYPVTQFQQTFSTEADCQKVLTKLRLDAASSRQTVIVGHCTEIIK